MATPSTVDGVLLPFSLNFKTRITAAPTTYNLTAGDATLYGGLHDAYAAALAVTDNPGTRTKAAIATKNTAKKALLLRLREYIRIIKADLAVTDAMRADLGLPPRDGGGTPILPPTSRPLLVVDPFGNIRVTDEATPTKRARPAGTVGALIFTKVLEPGAPLPATPEDGRYAGMATRDTFAVTLSPADAGRVLWAQAFYVSPRGAAGPASAPVTTRIVA